jgi:hypothetical protein
MFGLILESDTATLDASLDLIDPGIDGNMHTNYGIMSLSRSDTHFRQNSDYWTGPIWVNCNFLILQGLRKFYSQHPRAMDIYNYYREALIKNMVKMWKKTGYIWEIFDPEDGHGRGNHPFTGWSSLITVLISNHTFTEVDNDKLEASWLFRSRPQHRILTTEQMKLPCISTLNFALPEQYTINFIMDYELHSIPGLSFVSFLIFGVLIDLSVYLVRFRKDLKLYLWGHQLLMLLILIWAIAMPFLAFRLSSQTMALPWLITGDFSNTIHFALGIIVYVLVALQIMLGILRYGQKMRPNNEYTHRRLGIILLVLSKIFIWTDTYSWIVLLYGVVALFVHYKLNKNTNLNALVGKLEKV